MKFDLNSFKSVELLKSSKGTRESIYRESVFAGLEKDEFKKMRKNLRNLAENFFSSVINITDEKKAQNLAKDFEKFYLQAYKVNDYSLASVCSANMDDEKKQIFSKGLEKFKKILKK